MGTINQQASTPFTTSSLLAHWSGPNQDTRYDTVANLITLIEASLTDDFVGLSQTQYASPTTGQTVQVTDNTTSTHLILTPAGTIAAGTVKLPIATGSAPNATDKQTVIVNTSQTITTLTVDGNGATLRGDPTTLTADGFFTMKYDAQFNIWNRIG